MRYHEIISERKKKRRAKSKNSPRAYGWFGYPSSSEVSTDGGGVEESSTKNHRKNK